MYFTNGQTHYVHCDASTHCRIFSYLHTMTTVYINGIHIHFDLAWNNEYIAHSSFHKLTIHTPALNTPNTATCAQTGEAIKVTLERHIFDRQAYQYTAVWDVEAIYTCVEWGMRMLFSLTMFLTAVTATSGEYAHTRVRGRGTCWGEGVALLPSGLAGNVQMDHVK